MVPLRSFSSQWDHKYSIENRDIPLLDIIFLCYPKLSETKKHSSTSWFGTVRQNNLTENRYTHPLSCRFFFRYQNFCGTQKGAPMKFFGTSRKHFFYGRSWHNLLKQKIFDTLFWWHTNGSPTKCFATVRQQIFYRKSLYSLLRRKFFRYPKLLKHRSFPLRNDSVLWDKTIWRKIVILASSLIAFFSIPEFFSNTEGVLYEFFTHSETESFDRKTW